MIIKPFGEKGIPMLQGSIKDVSIIRKNICALLEEDDTEDFPDPTATVQSGKLKTIPYNARLWDLINKITDEYYQKIPISVGSKRIVQVWAGLMKEGDFHILHNHQEIGGIAGGLYLKIPEMKPPQGNISWVSDDKVFSWSPKVGDYFVWPSQLIHSVYPFKGPESRIMISWFSV
jgi:hypothetical protein